MKKVCLFSFKKESCLSLISTCGRFLWFWLKQNIITVLINNNMMLISDNLDNAEVHHSLGKPKKVNLNLNFAHRKYLVHYF